MVANNAKPAPRQVLSFGVGVGMCLLAVVCVLVRAPWYLSLGNAAGAGIILLGRRRILRAGVTRTNGHIVCHYFPWYDGTAYVTTLSIPLIGLAAVGAASAPGHQPSWLWSVGILLIAVGPLMMYFILLIWRGSILIISANALTTRTVTVRSARELFAPNDNKIEIRREQIESIAPDIDALKAGSQARQVQITYHATTSNNTAAVQTLSIGQQLTVKPANLLHALQLWNNAATDNPEELLDRIERILCSRHNPGPDARI